MIMILVEILSAKSTKPSKVLDENSYTKSQCQRADNVKTPTFECLCY